jgi:predicted amidophosphoribosyltransferase
VLFGPATDLSSSLEYPCASCGTAYCIDCMAALKKTGGICPKCGRPIGW